MPGVRKAGEVGMMPNQERVLHGLDSCGFHDGIPNICEVTECPYRDDKCWCVHELAHDAGLLISELLKAQEPRVLSWDEVYANNRPFVVWHESRYGDEAEPLAFVDGEYVNSECTLYVEMNFANQRDYMADRDDGFRFWTAEPTFEQMEATPWE